MLVKNKLGFNFPISFEKTMIYVLSSTEADGAAIISPLKNIFFSVDNPGVIYCANFNFDA